MKKEKRKIKTRQEIIDAIRADKFQSEQLVFMKEKFYPTLVETDDSVEGIKSFLSIFSVMARQEAEKRIKDILFKELNILQFLEKGSEDYDKWSKLIELFDNMPYYMAIQHIDKMKGEIESNVSNELKERKLSTLKTNWIDEL